MKTCSVCGEQSELGRPEEHSTYSACVRALKSQLARQRALLQRTLDIAGGFIGEDGDVHFTSEGYGAWTRRKGGQRTQEILAENEELKRWRLCVDGAKDEETRRGVVEMMSKAEAFEIVLAPLRRENERLRAALDVMLNNAQTLRIQQVQATATWERIYRDKADAAWKAINDAHCQNCDEARPPTCQHVFTETEPWYPCAVCSAPNPKAKPPASTSQ